jgi:general secretion pathway protein G
MSRGFTVVELLVVMAIMAILAGAAFPLAQMSMQRERERELKRALWEIRDAIDAHKKAADRGQIAKVGGGYPPSLEVLAAGVPRVDGSAGRMYFMRRVPLDPFVPVAPGQPHAWGLRSYDSPPDRPAPGADVYDVYSRSERSGLNGVPLKQW